MTDEVAIHRAGNGKRLVETIERKHTMVQWNSEFEDWVCQGCNDRGCKHASIVRSIVGDVLPLDEQ